MKDDNDTMTPAALDALLQGDFANALIASTQGGIEAQEAQGQADFVKSSTLPRDCPRQLLEKLGFEFGEEINDLFVGVIFPEGWRMEATEHSMCSDLIDPDGNIRGGVFYKAAFYDQSSNLTLNCCIGFERINSKTELQYNAYMKNNGNKKILFETEIVAIEEYSEGWFDLSNTMEDTVVNWISENYKEWKDPMAYWGDDA